MRFRRLYAVTFKCPTNAGKFVSHILFADFRLSEKDVLAIRPSAYDVKIDKVAE